MPSDDLDEKLFADELSNAHIERQHQPTVSGISKRRTWRWKQTLTNSLDEEDVGAGKAHSSSSVESSRRSSMCSTHSSPSKSSPKKTKDQQSKKTVQAVDNTDDFNQRSRKDSKERSDTTFGENRLSAGARLYSVLEEQALGEAIRDSMENMCIGNDDIPIQVIKEESGGDNKGNLVSISEEQETAESNRGGSMRQSKEQKSASKITNFPVLGKKPREKDGKVQKNAATSDKEKKLGTQAISKENIKGSSSMLNNDQMELDGNINSCAIRKKNNVAEGNSISTDPSMALIDGERLALAAEVSDNPSLESSINLRAHNETETSLTSSIQVSSV